MAYSPTELLTVYLDSQNQTPQDGRLAFKERQILFEYDASFLTSGMRFRDQTSPQARRIPCRHCDLRRPVRRIQ